MQRTVKSTVVNYAKVEMVNGEAKATLNEIKINGVTDEKLAIRKAKKELGEIAVLSTSIAEDLYILEDEIFFKYAHIVKPNEQ